MIYTSSNVVAIVVSLFTFLLLSFSQIPVALSKERGVLVHDLRKICAFAERLNYYHEGLMKTIEAHLLSRLTESHFSSLSEIELLDLYAPFRTMQ